MNDPDRAVVEAEAVVDGESGRQPEGASPRADLHDGVGWVMLGILIVAMSYHMDRLEAQHINPWTVPGLVPGLLGLGMILIGGLVVVRSWERGARLQAGAPPTDAMRMQRKRGWLAIVLCVIYSVVLIGHGLAFWVASSIYVAVSILAFNRLNSDPAKRRLSLRSVMHAVLIGVLASLVIWLAFERLFLVRLP